jgi:amidase
VNRRPGGHISIYARQREKPEETAMPIDRRTLLTGAASAAVSVAGARLNAFAQSTGGAASSKADLSYRSVAELRAMLDARQLSALELLDHTIKRIETYDGKINAVVVRDFERARDAARTADAALARGERKPLLGIPLTVKESFNVAGLQTSWGLPSGRDWRAADDAVAVTRLKAAGAVVLGKTNLATAIADWQSFNAVYGTTNNPWDLSRTPGGSSGGSAAALAAGYVALELGSDISNSIRVPAHLCGVFGHKPTSDLVPQRGHAPPRVVPLQTDLTNGLGVAGPLARTAADLALALDLLIGPDVDQAGAYRVSLPAARHSSLQGYRVLVIDDHPLMPIASEVRASLERLVNQLAAKGVAIKRSSPLLPDLAESARLHTRMVRNFVAFGREPEFFQRMRDAAAALPASDNSLKAERLRAPLLNHHAWMAGEIARARLRQQWRVLFNEFDVVLCPPLAVPAFAHNQIPDQEDRTIDIDGKSFPYLSLIVWATLATPPGLPATVMPISRSPTGLPIGVQIIGAFLEDRTTLAFAALVEREFGGFEPPPSMRSS